MLASGWVITTVKTVTAPFHVHDTVVPQEISAVVPSGSNTSIVPKTLPFIFSLNVSVNASPGSLRSLLPMLLTMRASAIVGGVKSGAPVVNVAVEGLGRLFADVSMISPGCGTRVTVKVVLPGSGAFRRTANVLCAVT